MKNALLFLAILLFSFQTFAQKNFPDSSDVQKWEVVTWSFFMGSCQKTIIKTGATLSLCDGHWTEVLDCDAEEQNCYLMGYFQTKGDSVMVRHKDIILRNGQWKDTVYCDEPAGLMYDFSASLEDTLQCRVAYGGNSDTECWNIGNYQRVFEGVSRDVLSMNFRPYTNIPEVIWAMDWTQGIGSDIHPFYSLTCMGDHCEIEQQLTRVWLNDRQIYQDTVLRFSFPCNGWVSNDALSGLSISTYPNPTSGVVEIDVHGLDLPRVLAEVYDVFGKKTKVYTLTNGKNPINLEGLPRGMYLLKFEYQGQAYVEKLVLR